MIKIIMKDGKEYKVNITHDEINEKINKHEFIIKINDDVMVNVSEISRIERVDDEDPYENSQLVWY